MTYRKRVQILDHQFIKLGDDTLINMALVTHITRVEQHRGEISFLIYFTGREHPVAIPEASEKGQALIGKLSRVQSGLSFGIPTETNDNPIETKKNFTASALEDAFNQM
jgi:hypothetical protein